MDKNRLKTLKIISNNQVAKKVKMHKHICILIHPVTKNILFFKKADASQLILPSVICPTIASKFKKDDLNYQFSGLIGQNIKVQKFFGIWVDRKHNQTIYVHLFCHGKKKNIDKSEKRYKNIWLSHDKINADKNILPEEKKIISDILFNKRKNTLLTAL